LDLAPVGVHERHELVHHRTNDLVHHLGIDRLHEPGKAAQVGEQDGDRGAPSRVRVPHQTKHLLPLRIGYTEKSRDRAA
jgi:hypothetical protein